MPERYMTEDSKLRQLNNEERQVAERERALLEKIAELDALEEEITSSEKELRMREARRKQLIVRLPESLWRDIAGWADDDYRSVNGQIEYLLARSVRERSK